MTANPTRGEPEEERAVSGVVELLLGNTEDTLGSGNVYTKQQRIAELAGQMPDASFTSLAYHIDLEWWFFAGAGFAALLIAWFTVGLQTVKAARVNPVDCLKDE